MAKAHACSDPKHHVHDAAGFVAAVERACNERGLRLTAIRARVLGLIAEAGQPIKAYDLLDRILATTRGQGVDVVLDSVGRATQELSLAALAHYGHLVCYGDASGFPPPIDPDRLYDRSLKVSAFGLRQDVHPETWRAARQDLLRQVEEGRLQLTIARVLPLSEAAEAHRLLESRQVVGKLLLAAD